ncbi:alpha-1,6-mannosyltransferase subunit [Pochonia chlamydosporia 170]|uniref:Mannosyltransferase n=1 Tax=Pochonia chlamydosporia 170 TaxID=1380566 RepID=A0A179FDG2_METCM|nr:alpha-1,6-mannosyltransferase subunit [Pochonia chlamydosporia 170]OAQ63331.1 alpha-1,6-mannosyltransferase subunit [Pochonia chlamydosporia 170]
MALDAFLNSLIFILPLLHILISPHTKVEESFNVQATHDILIYGTPTADIHARFLQTYDHFTFPGAVPRTFVGAVILAGISQPIVALVGFQHAQLIVRCVLCLFNASCLLFFKNAASQAYGAGAARWWAVLTMSQFHLVYYLGRTLPNMFAFGLTTLAMGLLLKPTKSNIRAKQALSILTFAGIVFRSEIAILLLTTTLPLLLTRRLPFRTVILVGAISAVGSLAISVPIDSYFWQKPLWPELSAFYYNAVQGSSSNWGTSPWHYYFTSALPRLLLNPLAIPLILLSLTHPSLRRQTTTVLIPSLSYMAIYSLQPHKETRFMFYTIPPVTLAAALSANYISTRFSKSNLYKLTTIALVFSVLATSLASTSMLLLSSLNYPGGEALTQLYALAPHSNTPINAHADVLTCMTGLTLFNQNKQGLPLALSDSWDVQDTKETIYFFDKTEKSEKLGWPIFWQQFDYVLLEDTALALGEWDVLGVVYGYSGIEVLRPGQKEPGEEKYRALGLGADVKWLRGLVRKYTGGWWVGPRMAPKIHIMKQRGIVQ